MSLYLIGDLQGCDAALARLLAKIDFSASRDTLYLLGDLVNRGPDSLAVLRRLHRLGDSAQCLLGNHDLHALAVWQGVRPSSKGDTLTALLAAQDCDTLMNWLRFRPLAIHQNGWLMVHAGVLPTWSATQTIAYGREIESQLQGEDHKSFLQNVFGNSPVRWHDGLTDVARQRVILNALTRLRFCTAEGEMEFSIKGGLADAPDGYYRWFEVPGRQTLDQPIAFGHWSTLNAGSSTHQNTLALDTGCVWGGCLTAAKLGAHPADFELVQVKCKQAQKPGS